MFTLQIQCATLNEAQRILACIAHSADPAIVKDVAAQIPAASAVPGESQAAEPAPEQQESKKRGRPRREVAEKPAASEVVGEPAAASTPASQALTESDIREALKGVQAKYGEADMAKALAVLSEFGAGRISEVKPADYVRFIAACKDA